MTTCVYIYIYIHIHLNMYIYMYIYRNPNSSDQELGVGVRAILQIFVTEVAVPAHVEGPGSLRDELVLRLIKKIIPDTSYQAAYAALHKAYLVECPEAEYALDIDPDLLLEVISLPEVKEVKTYMSEIKVASKQYNEVMSNRRGHIPRHFRREMPMAKGKAKAKAAPKAPHWRPPAHPKAADATIFIKKHAPAGGDVVCDEYNGRWRCFYTGRRAKSVSWTKRGLKEAAGVVLHQLWTWSKETTDVGPSFPVEDLLLPEVA